jgi:hypothetical protein
MRPRIGDAEADRDDVEERRVGKLCALPAEIIVNVEDELEPASARLVGSPTRKARRARREPAGRWSRPGYAS